MRFIQRGRVRTKYIIAGLQIVIFLAVAVSWFLHRGNLYSKNYTVDEYLLSENATVENTVVSMEGSDGDAGIFLSTQPFGLKKGS